MLRVRNATHSRRSSRGRGLRRAPWLARRGERRGRERKSLRGKGRRGRFSLLARRLRLASALVAPFDVGRPVCEERAKVGKQNEWPRANKHISFPPCSSFLREGRPRQAFSLCACVSFLPLKSLCSLSRTALGRERGKQTEERKTNSSPLFFQTSPGRSSASALLPGTMYSNFKEKAIGECRERVPVEDVNKEASRDSGGRERERKKE